MVVNKGNKRDYFSYMVPYRIPFRIAFPFKYHHRGARSRLALITHHRSISADSHFCTITKQVCVRPKKNSFK